MKLQIAIVLLFSFNLVFGQVHQITKIDGSTISTAGIDKTVQRLMDAANVQGLSLSVINNKKTVLLS
jgi:hypothetical protein